MKEEKLKNVLSMLIEMEDNFKKFQEIFFEVSVEKLINSEEQYEHYLLGNVSYHFEEVINIIERLRTPVFVEGILTKDDDNSYQVNGYKINIDEEIEFWQEDDYKPEWSHYIPSKVGMTFNGECFDFFLKALGEGKKIEGIKVRIK